MNEDIERLQGALNTARNRVKALERNGAELLARAEQTEATVERVGKALRDWEALERWDEDDALEFVHRVRSALDAPEARGGES